LVKASFFLGLRSAEVSVVFMYFNVLLNGLQGLFLLLVYCVVGSEVRNAFRKTLEKNSVFSSLLEKESRTRSSDPPLSMGPILSH